MGKWAKKMAKIEKIKEEYIGKWIGIKDNELVAVSVSHRELCNLWGKRFVKEMEKECF